MEPDIDVTLARTAVGGRIIEILRRAAFQRLAGKSHKVGLQQLQFVGARMPSVMRPKIVISL